MLIREFTEDREQNPDSDLDSYADDANPRVAALHRAAQIAHPYATSPQEALALYIMDMEDRQVARLGKENEEEEETIRRLRQQDKSLEDMIKNLQQQVNDLKGKEPVAEETAQEFGVFKTGGSIGSKNDKPVKTFTDRGEARAKARSMNKLLTPGEKEYYKIKYVVKPIKEDAAGVGVVAKNKKMAKDPRYSMSMTVDVQPGTDKKNQKALYLESKIKKLREQIKCRKST